MNGGNRFERDARRNDRPVLGECPPGWGASVAGAGDPRLAEMRALLVQVRPSSDAEALRCLRSAFPETTLAARVAAIAAAAHD
ncbi:MAG: hypothetical protein GX458_18065 [Phyllobacteriaceae bacterium]|nr:hypothetical protein [Phyllobacteriaceae bacterium]